MFPTETDQNAMTIRSVPMLESTNSRVFPEDVLSSYRTFENGWEELVSLAKNLIVNQATQQELPFLGFSNLQNSPAAALSDISVSWEEPRGREHSNEAYKRMLFFCQLKLKPLLDALCDLKEVRNEAREEGFPEPSDQAIDNTYRLLAGIYSTVLQHFTIYPTPDGEVAIDVSGGFGHSVLLLCDSEGGVLCLVNMDGVHRRARYTNSESLPDGFIREALHELKLKSTPAHEDF